MRHMGENTLHTLFFPKLFFFFPNENFFSCFVLVYWHLSLTSIKLSLFFCLDFSQGELKENVGVTTFDEVGPVTASQNRSLLVSTAFLSSFTAEIKRLGIHQKMAAIRSQHHLKEY